MVFAHRRLKVEESAHVQHNPSPATARLGKQKMAELTSKAWSLGMTPQRYNLQVEDD
ncbi:MAG: hypothetical protein JWN24_1969 [Phycisphaerales bacterium]|nr:hypothetical protein [Phycisphaerales bacterium]